MKAIAINNIKTGYQFIDTQKFRPINFQFTTMINTINFLKIIQNNF